LAHPQPSSLGAPHVWSPSSFRPKASRETLPSPLDHQHAGPARHPCRRADRAGPELESDPAAPPRARLGPHSRYAQPRPINAPPRPAPSSFPQTLAELGSAAGRIILAAPPRRRLSVDEAAALSFAWGWGSVPCRSFAPSCPTSPELCCPPPRTAARRRLVATARARRFPGSSDLDPTDRCILPRVKPVKGRST
jgi:hypothetical protein